MNLPLNRLKDSPFRKADWVCGLALLLSTGLGVTNSAQASTVYALNNIFSPAIGPVSPLGIVTLTDLGPAVRFDVVNPAGVGAKLDSL
jgi:hypothetical protein